MCTGSLYSFLYVLLMSEIQEAKCYEFAVKISPPTPQIYFRIRPI